VFAGYRIDDALGGRVETTDIAQALPALPEIGRVERLALDQESLHTDTVARRAAPTSVAALIAGFP
jgi:hypothetical protein